MRQTRQSNNQMLGQQSIFTSNNPDARLRMKLYSALRHTLVTCILGTSNKIHDYERTNAWCIQEKRYYGPGWYRNSAIHPPTSTNDHALSNMTFDPGTRRLSASTTKKWYFFSDPTNNSERNLMLQCRGRGDPLGSPQFNINNLHIKLLVEAMMAAERRHGNCLDRALVVAKYLWENSDGIDRIEIISTSSFSHFFVIINRTGELDSPNTWGNAWIVDAWYGEAGIIFPASEFESRITEIKAFAKTQLSELNKIGLIVDTSTCTDKPEVLKTCVCEIKPAVHLYPTFSMSPLLTIEYYYYLLNVFTSDLHGDASRGIPLFIELRSHQSKFKESLVEITRINGVLR